VKNGSVYELLIMFTTASGFQSQYIAYSQFKIADELDDYRLTLGSVKTAAAGVGMLCYIVILLLLFILVDDLAKSRNQKFGTADRDTDELIDVTCGK
jgi:hypothetical protein